MNIIECAPITKAYICIGRWLMPCPIWFARSWLYVANSFLRVFYDSQVVERTTPNTPSAQKP